MASVYYNDNDLYCCEWLCRLMARGLIPVGDVDHRGIEEVTGDDVRGYDQCHFFAGIGGWAYALELAGWPVDQPVWTGSCPCQPFSVAGKREGINDERHLWPEFRRLIEECRPSVAFGEQVASADGRLWLSGVRLDLEEMGYAVGAVDSCAAGITAPHIRQRLWWVADRRMADTGRNRGTEWGRVGHLAGAEGVAEGQKEEWERVRDTVDDGRADGRVAHPLPTGRTQWGTGTGDGQVAGDGGGHGGMAHTTVQPQRESQHTIGTVPRSNPRGDTGGNSPGSHGMAHRILSRLEGRTGQWEDDEQKLPALERSGRDIARFTIPRPWDNYTIIGPDLFGRYRRIEPGTVPVAPRLSSTMAQLHALGNSIVPQVAAEFIRAYMETRGIE